MRLTGTQSQFKLLYLDTQRVSDPLPGTGNRNLRYCRREWSVGFIRQ
jgi:hypothetical protein